MKEHMTPERRRQIRARSEAATKGPWRMRHRMGSMTVGETTMDESAGLGWDWDWEHPTNPPQAMRGVFARHADAAFVEKGRDDIPALLDEIDLLLAEGEADGVVRCDACGTPLVEEPDHIGILAATYGFCWRCERRELFALIAQLQEALQALRDEQNGPPLPRDRDVANWQAAMSQAEAALGATPASAASLYVRLPGEQRMAEIINRAIFSGPLTPAGRARQVLEELRAAGDWDQAAPEDQA